MRAAIYARVSSDRQEQEQTIQSQLSELRMRLREDAVASCLEITDEGYGRDNLVRPGLDRLRDLVAQGDVNRVYVQCPDRLAAGAKLVLLYEEFRQHGVEVIFLKGSVEDTPEGKLLLHVQGAIGEYERTKIAERTRRGKLYWARHGAMVGGNAPYGYRLVRRSEAARARLEIDESQASTVRQMYRMLIEQRLSTRALAMRLTERGVLTARGAVQWQPTAVDRILRNPVYKGSFIYQRAESVVPAHHRSADPYRKRRKSGRRPRPETDWITIPVPPIVEPSLWESAQGQLRQNSLHSSRNTHHSYLLSRLIRCPRCGSTYTGVVQHGYRRYRCTNADASVTSTGKRCPPGSVSADLVEEVVWRAVAEALQRPEVLVQEYEKRLTGLAKPGGYDAERKQLGLALKRIKVQEDRLTDAYLNEALDLPRYKAEMHKLAQRQKDLERAGQDLDRRERQEMDTRKALEDLERFCRQVSAGLNALTFEERQQLLRLIVERITVENGRVRIESVIPTGRDVVELRARHPEALEG